MTQIFIVTTRVNWDRHYARKNQVRCTLRTIYQNHVAEQEKTGRNAAAAGWDRYLDCNTISDLHNNRIGVSGELVGYDKKRLLCRATHR